MEILIFVLLAGLWAAFLLPPFLSSRRDTPISSTQRFDRSLARLASVHGQGHAALTRERVLARRRRAFVVLLTTAVLTLTLALWRRSLNLLFLHLVVDALAVGYVAMLLEIKQRRVSVGRRAYLEPYQADQEVEEAEDARVRVVASG